MKLRKIKNKEKKYLYVLGGILVICLIGYFILQGQTPMTPGGTNTIPTEEMVSESPKTAALSLEQQGDGTVNVVVDAGAGTVSAVQLALSFDPGVLENVQIKKGTYFVSPFELINLVDSTKGTITYAIGISPSGRPQGGKGVVAQITYNAKQGVTSQTRLDFLPQTKVTSEGIDSSVLQNPQGISIRL